MKNFLLQRHESLSLLEEFEAHRKSCANGCRQASSIRGACPKGRDLHELAVREAQRARRAGETGWQQEINLNRVPSERALKEWLGEAEGERRKLVMGLSTLEGIDVSQWQGAFPWDQALTQGVLLGIAKASEGDGYTDPEWGHNLSSLLAPGPIVPGSYHFSREDLGNPAVAEAAWYLNRHPAQCFNRSQPWVFALDSESAGGSAGWVYAFLSAVSLRTGHSCWFYSFQNWIQTRSIRAYDYPLWLAWPDANGSLPNEGWPAITMQQYGLRGFAGVGGVDANRFLGDMPALLTLAGVGETRPAPPPAMQPLILGVEDDMGLIPHPDPTSGRFDEIYVGSGGDCAWGAWGGGAGMMISYTQPLANLGSPGNAHDLVQANGAYTAYQGVWRINIRAIRKDGSRWLKVVNSGDFTVIQDWTAVPSQPNQLVTAAGATGPTGPPGPVTYVPHRHVVTEDSGTPI